MRALMMTFLLAVVSFSYPSFGESDLLCKDVLALASVQNIASQMMQPWSGKDEDLNDISLWLERHEQKSLLRQVDPYQMTTTHFRNWWIDQFVDLRMKQVDAEDDEVLIPRSLLASKTVSHLVVRSLINEGLKSIYSENPTDGSPRLSQRLLFASRVIRYHPIFKFLVQWTLPTKFVVLTDEQLQRVLAEGMPAFQKYPDLAKLLKKYNWRSELSSWNYRLHKLMVVGFTLASTYHMYPKIEASMEQQSQLAQQQSTMKAMTTIEQYSGANETTLLLFNIAQQNIQVVNQDFFLQNHREASASEEEEINEDVCKDIFGRAHASTCLGLIHSPQ